MKSNSVPRLFSAMAIFVFLSACSSSNDDGTTASASDSVTPEASAVTDASCLAGHPVTPDAPIPHRVPTPTVGLSI